MACKLYWEEEGILFSHSGTVTSQEIQEMNDIMYGDQRFGSIIYQISDYTAVTENQVGVRAAKVIGTLDRTSSHWNQKKMRIAVVTTDEAFIPVVHDYFREFEGTSWLGKIFATLEQAREWVL